MTHFDADKVAALVERHRVRLVVVRQPLGIVAIFTHTPKQNTMIKANSDIKSIVFTLFSSSFVRYLPFWRRPVDDDDDGGIGGSLRAPKRFEVLAAADAGPLKLLPSDFDLFLHTFCTLIMNSLFVDRQQQQQQQENYQSRDDDDCAPALPALDCVGPLFEMRAWRQSSVKNTTKNKCMHFSSLFSIITMHTRCWFGVGGSGSGSGRGRLGIVGVVVSC